MDCEFLNLGFCEVASNLAGWNVQANPDLCRHCIGSKSPRAPNVHTISAAIKKRADESQPIPEKLRKLYAVATATTAAEVDRRQLQAAHWVKLHSYAFARRAWNPSAAAAWFDEWQRGIPICAECLADWRELLEKWPPVFTSALAFFERGHLWHNRVNQRIGKPVISIDKALLIYANKG